MRPIQREKGGHGSSAHIEFRPVITLLGGASGISDSVAEKTFRGAYTIDRLRATKTLRSNKDSDYLLESSHLERIKTIFEFISSREVKVDSVLDGRTERQNIIIVNNLKLNARDPLLRKAVHYIHTCIAKISRRSYSAET